MFRFVECLSVWNSSVESSWLIESSKFWVSAFNVEKHRQKKQKRKKNSNEQLLPNRISKGWKRFRSESCLFIIERGAVNQENLRGEITMQHKIAHMSFVSGLGHRISHVVNLANEAADNDCCGTQRDSCTVRNGIWSTSVPTNLHRAGIHCSMASVHMRFLPQNMWIIMS